jgi:hypothetical protein
MIDDVDVEHEEMVVLTTFIVKAGSIEVCWLDAEQFAQGSA